MNSYVFITTSVLLEIFLVQRWHRISQYSFAISLPNNKKQYKLVGTKSRFNFARVYKPPIRSRFIKNHLNSSEEDSEVCTHKTDERSKYANISLNSTRWKPGCERGKEPRKA